MDDKTFKCHKNVLAGSCPYFDAMFASEMVETTLQEIQLHEISSEAMELLIDYCYTAQITIEERNVQQLLPAACLLQVGKHILPVRQVFLDDRDSTLLL